MRRGYVSALRTSGKAIPQPDRTLAVLGADYRERSRPEYQQAPLRGGQPEQACAEHAREVAVAEHQHVAVESGDVADDGVGTTSGVVHRLAAWASVAPQKPIRALRVDVRRRPAFVIAVVQLDQAAVDDR